MTTTLFKHGQKGVLIAFDKQFIGEMILIWYSWQMNCGDFTLYFDQNEAVTYGKRTTRDWKWFPFPDEEHVIVDNPKGWRSADGE
jgi:hypothetical protein